MSRIKRTNLTLIQKKALPRFAENIFPFKQGNEIKCEYIFSPTGNKHEVTWSHQDSKWYETLRL